MSAALLGAVDYAFTDDDWSALGSGAAAGTDGQVLALATVRGELYAGGTFTRIGGVAAKHIARWNGTFWSALGAGTDAPVASLVCAGDELYVGGSFSSAGGVAAPSVARWSGSAWSALGTGLRGEISSLTMMGGDLYAGGLVQRADGTPEPCQVWRWNGGAWSAVTGGWSGDRVSTMTASGNVLYVAHYLAAWNWGVVMSWDGTVWSHVDEGMTGPVHALTVSEGYLYAGGEFLNAAAASVANLARWNGRWWEEVSGGVDGPVRALAAAPGAVYVGGEFIGQYCAPVAYLACWNGRSWTSLGSGVDAPVRALAVSDDRLHAGGDFTTAGGKPCARVASASLEVPQTWIVRYEGNEESSGTVPATQTAALGTAIYVDWNVGSLRKDGCVFAGWSRSLDGTVATYACGSIISTNTSTTLYARWVPAVYAVRYVANGATSGWLPAAQSKTHGVDLALAANSGGLARAGHVFGGWNTDAAGTGVRYAAGATCTRDGDLLLYAHWVPVSYAVTYHANGATGGVAPAEQAKSHGINLYLAWNGSGLVKDGCVFAGWATTPDGLGSVYPAGGIYSGNAALALYARWLPITYLVTYDANGATSGETPDDQIKVHGVKLELAGNAGLLVKDGQVFVGWNTDAEGTGIAYPVGAAYIANGGSRLFAQWRQEPAPSILSAVGVLLGF